MLAAPSQQIGAKVAAGGRLPPDLPARSSEKVSDPLFEGLVTVCAHFGGHDVSRPFNMGCRRDEQNDDEGVGKEAQQLYDGRQTADRSRLGRTIDCEPLSRLGAARALFGASHQSVNRTSPAIAPQRSAIGARIEMSLIGHLATRRQIGTPRRNEADVAGILEYCNILIYVNSSLRTFKAQVFQALANPTRIAIVEALRDGELTAGALLTLLGGEQSNLSQHLAVLRAKHVVASRKSGNQIYYALRDPVLIQILDLLKQYVSAHLNDTLSMLGEMAPEHDRRV